ncbi:hypothetical protein RSSM_01753 [Rhodopirellula sallentina SM41]|uniref:Uncharacterized protein n=1 Tax=Rhodopirellula sallentina SM41 TaxID=1263870 RepID=M5U5T4_9BACT|nr:hypothetical protein RSSM_01753 [Rhodopirellula sallentina SM41]
MLRGIRQQCQCELTTSVVDVDLLRRRLANAESPRSVLLTD